MAVALPNDIMHLLCEELGRQKQFDTLFNCACASHDMAAPALTNLYRSHHESPVRGGGEDEGVSLPTKQLLVQKWAILWRSIIASSIGDTMFPYCRYIKTLDFRDLDNLLEEDYFKGKVSKHFFSGSMSRFHLMMNLPLKPNGKQYIRLNITAIIDAIGEIITQHTPTLEAISGKLLSSALIRWAPRLPRLQELELWDGTPLEDELVHASIREHCPHFNSLMIYTWLSRGERDERDHMFSKFIGSMRPQSLKAINAISDIGAGPETFLALSGHGESLKDLRLCVLDESLQHLSLLGGCIALESLMIDDVRGTTNLEETQNDVFLEMVAWLRKCTELRSLVFTRLQSAAALITPVLLEHNVRLRKLELDSYVLKDHQAFHQALVHQKDSLKFLSLKGESDGMFRDDVDIMVDSLRQLTELRVLELFIHEVFRDEHFVAITQDMEHLEDLYISGLVITDELLDVLAKLNNLRSVTFTGISKFTVAGLLEFIDCLGPGNQGIRIMIDMADPDTLITDAQINFIREVLAEKAGGSLEYTALRDPNISEFEDDSD